MAKMRPHSIPKTPKPGLPASKTPWWTDRRLRWHASSLSSLDDLQPLVKAALESQLKPDETIRQIISAPRQNISGKTAGWRRRLGIVSPWDWTPDWVLVVTNQHLLLAASTSPDAPPAITSTPISALLSLELGTILLFSWFEWTWANAGRAARQRIYFNTVGDRLFWDTLTFLRRGLIVNADAPCMAPPPADRDRGLEQLLELPFKFKNLIPRRLLLPDERIQAVIFQPTIWAIARGPFRRKRAPSLALVLTNYHLVVAQEDLGTGDANYGLIARYCPRERIKEVTLEPAGGDLWLNVLLDRDGAQDSLRVLFKPTAEHGLRELMAKLAAGAP